MITLRRTDGSLIAERDVASLKELVVALVAEGVSLAHADLEGANLRGADLEVANLFGAKLRGSKLGGASLVDASLVDADLRDADLRDADLVDASLRGANLVGAKIGLKIVASLLGGGYTLKYWWLAYVTSDGAIWLSYGCEAMLLPEWRKQNVALAKQHEPTDSTQYAAALRVLFRYLEGMAKALAPAKARKTKVKKANNPKTTKGKR